MPVMSSLVNDALRQLQIELVKGLLRMLVFFICLLRYVNWLYSSTIDYLLSDPVQMHLLHAWYLIY